MSTTDNAWPDLVDEFTGAYGTAPGLGADTELESLYARHPAITLARLNEARTAHAAGRVHSPWGFVLETMRKHDRAREQKPQDADRERDRELATAERYIRNAGIYLPTEAELLDDTFGTHGRLKHWADDLDLCARILNLYRREHPRAEATEAEALERANRFKQARAPKPEQPTDDIPL